MDCWTCQLHHLLDCWSNVSIFVTLILLVSAETKLILPAVVLSLLIHLTTTWVVEVKFS